MYLSCEVWGWGGKCVQVSHVFAVVTNGTGLELAGPFLLWCRSRAIKSFRNATQSGLLETVFRGVETSSRPIPGSLETDAVIQLHLL